ncbi:7074_t:CDS:2 [Funneliformis mosseae]|uniref:7074_t:CDS:1 n=1 Tax=Funneliformis mosseae TaxID=27381 RepID=A0A9N9A860_FUNMO|nr:7074_t:CDS:2 [Funneliformis mosseae]
MCKSQENFVRPKQNVTRLVETSPRNGIVVLGCDDHYGSEIDPSISGLGGLAPGDDV